MTNNSTSVAVNPQLIFRATQIRRPEEVYSLLQNFPSLYRLGLDLPKLSSDAIRRSSRSFQSVAGEASRSGVAAPAFGANYPVGAPAPPGSTVPLPPPDDPGGGGDSNLPRQQPVVDVRVPGWPVRDQGLRGTCVAHSLVACREHLALTLGEDPRRFDLSEQFLFWATKTRSGDPSPTDDGTWMEFGRVALEQIGVCREDLWLYDGTPKPGNVTHAGNGIPTPVALDDAKGFRHSASHFAQTGSAAKLLEMLTCSRRPVAISLPVFSDSLQPTFNNWNSPVSIAYGQVLDPPPTAVCTGGHAVCVTGFVPDEEESLGGYFIIRNSWGTQKFGRSAPTDGWLAPESGYGQVSASYVEKYLWERCAL